MGVPELEKEISAQGLKVKDLKTSKADVAAIKAEVAVLLKLKQDITALDPTHPQAIVDKKKKKKAPKAPAGPSKKELRILAKQKKAAEDRTKAKESEADSADIMGETGIYMSASITSRRWTAVRDVEPSLVGSDVWVRARFHACRAKGNLAFVVLRQGCFTVQGVASAPAVPKTLIGFLGKIPSESIVDIEASVAAAKVDGCTQSSVELVIKKCFIVSKAVPDLPFQIVDASRNENDPKEGEVTVGLDTRLNHRVIDLRTPANQAIMRIRSAVPLLFASYLNEQGFTGVNTPKLLGGSSEGGSGVFKLKYFGKECCLAQSPQLYKQMLSACADFERVYEIGPVFRAEDSNTRRHLCEFTGLDFEMAIYEHYYEVLDLFGKLFNHIFRELQATYGKELELVSQVYPFKPFKFLDKPLRISFAEGIQLLRDAGVTEEQQGAFDDLSTVNEKILGDLVLEKYDTDFYIMDKYPLSIRPFYTMPDPETYKKVPPAEQLSNSYDIFMRGQEICSGAQRVHDHALLMERVIHCHGDAGHGGPHPDSIKSYTDAFKYGAFPHGGGGVGLERVVMLYLDLTNIRKVSAFPRDPSRLTP
jgi:aspartyl-tRNA synthetase